jgi:predicted acyl esterase
MLVENGKMPEKSKAVSVKNPVFMLALSLLLCFIGALGAGLVKSNGDSVTVKELRWETPSGRMLAGQLFIPKNAGKDTPAPAIVCAHGWMLNREYQDEDYIEFSRRGYVVLSIDMYGHGYSDNVANNDWWKEDSDNGANGLYDGVQMLASLPFVDASKIGVIGNSNGATACNLAVMLDNKAVKPLIASVLLVVVEGFFQCYRHHRLTYVLCEFYFDNAENKILRCA